MTEDGRKVLAEHPIEQLLLRLPRAVRARQGQPVRDTSPPGQSRLVEEGHAGIDVEFYRVIEQPGSDPVRQRFSWSYKMFPNKYLVGKGAPADHSHHERPPAHNRPNRPARPDPARRPDPQSPGEGSPLSLNLLATIADPSPEAHLPRSRGDGLVNERRRITRFARRAWRCAIATIATATFVLARRGLAARVEPDRVRDRRAGRRHRGDTRAAMATGRSAPTAPSSPPATRRSSARSAASA